jgi:hypothetical protein
MNRRQMLSSLCSVGVISIPALAQIRFASPGSRSLNQRKVNRLIGEYNDLALKFNTHYGDKPSWEVKPEETAEIVAQMSLKLGEIYALLVRFDEEEK